MGRYKKYKAYVKDILRDYPRLSHTDGKQLTPLERKALKSVKAALDSTLHEAEGELKINLVATLYFTDRYTIVGAANKCHVSQRTAERWQSNFVKKVAIGLELEDE